MKQFASSFTHGMRNGSDLRRHVHTSQPDRVMNRVEEFFAPIAADGGPHELDRPIPMRERRSERRIAVRLPMQVRGKDIEGLPFEESTRSENLCRGGAAFCCVASSPRSNLEIRIPLPAPAELPRMNFLLSAAWFMWMRPGRMAR